MIEELPGPLEFAKRGGGEMYEPEDLNWVDQAEEEYVDVREKGAPEEQVCRGKRQRHGFKAPTCDLIDLDDVHFTNVNLLEFFVSESGTIKPRKQTGLCAKCQRQVAGTVKQARQMAVIPYIQEWR
jgi:ribosomal protein S18